MPGDDLEKLNSIEALKRKLFSKTYKTKIEYRDSFPHQVNVEVKDSWENPAPTKVEKFFMKTSMFKKFFIFSVAFFVIAALYVGFVFLNGGNNVSNENIEISILGNSFTEGGEDLPLIIGITNKNASSLELADLVVEYPRGSIGNSGEDKERQRVSLGVIPSGAVRNEDMKVVLYGEQGSLHTIKVSLEYRIAGSNAIFVKEKSYQVAINSTPIDLSITAPSEISPNQDLNLGVKATLNASKGASKVLVKVDYPVGFQFVSAKPAPSYGNNVWNLGDMNPGSEGDIMILGKMIDVFDGEEKTFNVSTGSQSDSDKTLIGVIFNSLGHHIAIKKPFIEAKILVNGVYAREYATNANTEIRGEIRWVNNLDTRINDMQITARISGNGVSRKSINPQQGFYDSNRDVLIWDRNSQSRFAGINPGESGAVEFSLATLPLFSGVTGMLSDPLINIEVSVSGKQAIEGNITKEVKNSETKTIRLISDLSLNTKALYFSGPFENSGPIPPKVEKETTYTITWSLANTSNHISKAQVRSTLPPWIKYTGGIFPPAEDLSFNASTRELIWNIGGISRGTGITEANREVSFQISFTPSLSQRNTTPTLVNDATLTGHDDFANVDLKSSRIPLNIRLDKDTAFPPEGARVVE
ncbi:MAG: hypothetical protein AAB438_01415 [Patescibacteria group bacterium]